MTNEELLERIVVDPKVMLGKPIIKGTRLTVKHIIDCLARGSTPQELTAEYEGLTRDDIAACLVFAANRLFADGDLPPSDEAA